MKKLSHLAAAAALAIGCLSSGVASAGPVCDITTCGWAGEYTYVGSMNATLGEFTSFARNVVSLRPPALNNTLSDFWIFEINPVQAGFQVNANFQSVNPEGINNFTVILKAVTSAAPLCGALGTQCNMGGSPTFSDIATSTPMGGGNVYLGGVTLNTGWYALAVTGTVTATGNTYTGQTSTNKVPAPGSLALVGVALLGAAVGMRRQKRA